MTASTGALTTDVRVINERTSIIALIGSVTASSEAVLMDAWTAASGAHTRAIIIDFSELEYLNSSGIGLLVTLLVRANRQHQKLLAWGLNDHYRHIFELTRLTDAIGIHDDEASALAAAANA